jgi:hypothetical protein
MGIDRSLNLQARRSFVSISIMAVAGLVMAATPALSQTATAPGAAPLAPQPRVAPAPQAPVVAPQPPVAAPQMPMAAPTPSTPAAPALQQNKPFTIRGNEQQLKEPAVTQGSPAIVGGTVTAAAKPLSPSDGTLVGGPDSKAPIAFRWTPIVPRPQEPTTYRLRVWQLMQGQNGTQVMQERQPVVTVDVDDHTTTSIPSPACAQKTCSFVWNVQALNRDGKPIGGTNGTSDPFGFRIAGR